MSKKRRNRNSTSPEEKATFKRMVGEGAAKTRTRIK
jgi:hypothetical protein